MKTAIMTDSNSGMPPQEAKDFGIFMISMPVIIDGKTFFEGVDLIEKDFYKSLTSGKDVSTSQPSPGDLTGMWDHILASGYDELVYIPMSSGLSNSCATAIMLSEDYGGKVQVADNHRISVTQRASILEAKELSDQGLSAKEIRAYLEDTAYDASIYITVDTLDFLKKGGRITPAAAALGSVLNIKPVLSIQGDKLDAFAKVRGMKKGKLKMIEALRNDLETRFRDIDRKRIHFVTSGAGISDEETAFWKDTVAKEFQADVFFQPLSLCIGAHTGPGAIGIGLYLTKK